MVIEECYFTSKITTFLSTCVVQSLVIEMVIKKWNWFEAYTELNKTDFVRVINFIFDTSYFAIDGQFFKQLDGTAMGSPCSPSLANLVMEMCVDSVLNNVDFTVPLAIYYVDDSLFSVPEGKVQSFLNMFNSYHESIQFTLEIEQNMILRYKST